VTPAGSAPAPEAGGGDMIVGADGVLRARRVSDALEALAAQLAHTQATLETFVRGLQDSLASATPGGRALGTRPADGAALVGPASPAPSSVEITVPKRLPLGIPVRRPEPPAPPDPSARFRPPTVLEDHVLRRPSGPEGDTPR
jgi:hypothetical protein